MSSRYLLRVAAAGGGDWPRFGAASMRCERAPPRVPFAVPGAQVAQGEQVKVVLRCRDPPIGWYLQALLLTLTMTSRSHAPALRVLVDGVGQVFGGGITVAIQLTKALALRGSEHRYTLLCSHPQLAEAEYPDNVEIVYRPDLSSRRRRWIWQQMSLPGEARRRKIDVILNLGGYATLASRVREIAVWQNPNVFSPSSVKRPIREHVYIRFQQWMQYVSMRKASHNVFLTEDSVSAAKRLWNLDGIPHSAILSGIDPGRISVTSPPALAEREPLAVAVGHAYFHKNYERLIDAMAVFQDRYDHPLRLEIVGAVYVPRYFEALKQRIEDRGLADRVRMTGEATPAEVLDKLGRAKLYVVTSLLETFGLTMFEAMGAGVPVLASNATCHPEVCGDAALYCDPYDASDIAARLYELATDTSLQASLQARGLARIEYFSWERSADQYLEVIGRVGRPQIQKRRSAT